MTDPEREQARRRLSTAFGWVAGAAFGLLTNALLFLAMGESYPLIPTTFVLFVAGAFGGMKVSDALGPRGFRALGIAAGVLLALLLTAAAAVWFGAAG